MMRTVATVVAGAGLVIVAAAGCSTTASTGTSRWGYDGPLQVFHQFQDGYVEDMNRTGPSGTPLPVGSLGGPLAPVPMGPSHPAGIAGRTYTDESQYTFAGAVGPRGQVGAMGPQGSAGMAGTAGTPGPMGPAGPAGVAGPSGAPGVTARD